MGYQVPAGRQAAPVPGAQSSVEKVMWSCVTHEGQRFEELSLAQAHPPRFQL